MTDESRAYITSGLAAVAGQVTVLAADIRTGDLAAARTAWLTAHLMWERLGSAYGMFDAYDDDDRRPAVRAARRRQRPRLHRVLPAGVRAVARPVRRRADRARRTNWKSTCGR